MKDYYVTLKRSKARRRVVVQFQFLRPCACLGIGARWGMENDKPLNQFQEVHKKVQERLERAREVQERDTALRNKKAAEEARREESERD